MRLKYEGVEGVTSVVSATWSALKSNFYNLTKAIGLLLILSFTLDCIYMYRILSVEETVQADFSENILWGVISGLLWLVIAVRTHRVLILHDALPSEVERSMDNRECYFRFALRVIWLSIIIPFCFLPMVIMFWGEIGIAKTILIGCAAIVSLILLSYVSRLLLVLPSIAIRAPMTFSEAHNQTEDHQFLLFFTVIIAPIFLAYIPYYLIASIFDSGIVEDVLASLLYGLVVVLEVALLSMTYIYVVQSKNDSNRGVTF